MKHKKSFFYPFVDHRSSIVSLARVRARLPPSLPLLVLFDIAMMSSTLRPTQLMHASSRSTAAAAVGKVPMRLGMISSRFSRRRECSVVVVAARFILTPTGKAMKIPLFFISLSLSIPVDFINSCSLVSPERERRQGE